MDNTMMWKQATLFPLLGVASAFVSHTNLAFVAHGQSKVFSSTALESPPSAPVDQVVVLKDAAAVGDEIRSIVVNAAKKAIDERGFFALAIPGGSILKMLVGDDIVGDWTTKTTSEWGRIAHTTTLCSLLRASHSFFV
jgi:hypothetical protein